MGEKKSIWLTGQGVMSRPENKETLFNVTLENISLSVRFRPELNQAYILIERENLILLKEAIDKELKK